MKIPIGRWLPVVFLLLSLPFSASAASLKDWLYKLFAIDRAPYEQFAMVRGESLGPVGTSLEMFDAVSGKSTVLWRSTDLRSPLALRDERIAVLRSAPIGKDSRNDGIWLLDRAGHEPRKVVAAPRLVEVLGEDPAGKLVVVQAMEGEGKFQLRLADVKEGTLRDPEGVEKTIETPGALAGLPRSGRIRDGRIVAVTRRGGLSTARLADNPSGIFEPLGPAEWPVQVIDAVWAGKDAVVYVARPKTDDPK
jgi:hypothetical protein